MTATSVSPAWRRVGPAALSYAGALLVAVLLCKTGEAFVGVALAHHAASAFAASAAWGLLLLAGFAGWGYALNLALFPRERADWALRGAWGWGAVTAVGSFLCAAHLATRGALIAVVGAGLLAFGAGLVRGYLSWSRRNVVRWARSAAAAAPFAVGAASIFALGLVAYLASILNGDFNPNDDRVCYFAFAREILDRGTLSQPFSLRRVSAYGAKSLLDAFQLAIPVPDTHLHLLDDGIALLAVMALLVGHVRSSPRTSRAIVLLLLLLTVTLPDLRINTATTMTGVVFFLGLYRTLSWRAIGEAPAVRAAVPVALLAAGACALRQNYLVPVAVLLGLEYGAPIVRTMRLRPFGVGRAPLVRAATTAAALVVLLAPWWAMSLRWCGTFLFPFASGNFDRSYSFFEPLGTFQELHYVWANVSYCLPVKAVPLFLVAALTAMRGSTRRTAAHLAIAALAGFAVLLRAYPDSDPPNLGRYYFGFTFAALLAIALAVGDAAGRRRPTGRARAEAAAGVALVVAAVALQLYGDREATILQVAGSLSALQPQVERPTPWAPPEPDPAYARVQGAVPEGEPIAVMVDEAGRFDFRRNRIESLDMVGAISPPPGLPLFGGADGVADYLVALGYRYAIVVDPDQAAELYRRDTWKKQAAEGRTVWKATARYYLQAFDVFDELRQTRAHVADAGAMTALDLTRVREAPPGEVIERVIQRSFGRFHECYETGLRADPTLGGHVRLRFVVEKDGTTSAVSDAGSDLPDASVVACVLQAFGKLVFPLHARGSLTATYSLSFTP